jgi:hypothetical protein
VCGESLELDGDGIGTGSSGGHAPLHRHAGRNERSRVGAERRICLDERS